MARINGVDGEKAKQSLDDFYSEEDGVKKALLVDGSNADAKLAPLLRSNTDHHSYLDLLRYSVIRYRTLCMWLTWFTCSVVYYGVALNTSNMGGNPYINCFVSAAVEIPAYAIVILLLKWLGRKPTLISTLLVAGLSCSAVPSVKRISSGLAIAFAMLGKLSVSGAFSVIYLFCSELFPTFIRSMGVGSSSVFARIGGMTAPYLLYLGKFNENAPYIVMGVLSCASAACITLLPETSGVALPETIDDLERMTWLCHTRRNK